MKTILIKTMISRLFMISTLIFFDATSAQNAGDEHLVNPGVNTHHSIPGVGPVTLNLDREVWKGAGGTYASSTGTNGNCHSEDRMFKFYQNGGSYVYQDVILPAGDYVWSFWTKWANTWDNTNTVNFDDAKNPTFTISIEADDTWQVVENIFTIAPSAADTWVQQSGVFVNDFARKVRIRFDKYSNTQLVLMFIDDVSLTYASPLLNDEEQLAVCEGYKTSYNNNCGC